MHILIVTRSMPHHSVGGMESVAWDLARAFTACGERVSVLTAAGPNLPQRGLIDGVMIHTISAPSNRYSPAWWKGSRACFVKNFADVDIVLSISAAANAIVAERSEGGSSRYYFQAHGTSSGEIISKLRSGSLRSYLGISRNLYWGLFRDAIYQRYDGVISVGAPVHAQMAKAPTRFLLGSTPETLIPNGIDEAAFTYDPLARDRVRKAYDIPKSARVMLSLSRLHVQKGISDTIKGFCLAAAGAPELRLLIAGDGPHAAALKAQSDAAGLQARVQFVGRIDRSAVPGILSASDALVFPTLRVEGAPINVLEALASGLPVIATPAGAAADLPCHRVSPGDVGALSAAMLAVAVSGATRSGLLPPKYTIRQTALRYLDVFCGKSVAEYRAG